MPRIEAPTVAEHHALRRAALLDAGRTLLADSGVEAVTPAAVGAAAGIARSSVYQYFDSTVALLAAIVEDSFPRATDQLRGAVDAAGTPRERVRAYLSTALRLATDPEHRSFDTLATSALPEEFRVRVAALHREQYAPLASALSELGIEDVALAGQLISGLLTGAARAVVAGAEVDRVERALLDAVMGGIVPPPDDAP